MSRTSTPAPPKPQLTEEDEARRATYSDVPTIRGFTGVVDYVADEFGIDITVHYVKRLVHLRTLPRYVIGGRLHTSPRDVFTAVILNSRRGPGRFRKPHRTGPTTAA